MIQTVQELRNMPLVKTGACESSHRVINGACCMFISQFSLPLAC